MRVEILFSELCNLYGDIANIKYLEKCLIDAEFCYTSINDEPLFVKERPTLIYMGPMSEKSQELVIEKLLQYRNRIIELIDDDVVFLVTGNAIEIFGEYILAEDRTKIKALGIFNIYAKRDMMHRYNTLVLGKYRGIDIVGFKSQFSQCYGDNYNNYFIRLERGTGINTLSDIEGIHVHNFFGTYILGPILILNPLFTKHLLSLMGVKKIKLKYEKEAMLAYSKRLEEFKDKMRKDN